MDPLTPHRRQSPASGTHLGPTAPTMPPQPQNHHCYNSPRTKHQPAQLYHHCSVNPNVGDHTSKNRIQHLTPDAATPPPHPRTCLSDSHRTEKAGQPLHQIKPYTSHSPAD
ncbi:hypothetical protein AMECASPLE_032931 [Ameca splendens]|uniref:Uncharacterized protein n=1 Tax=Ameca splendens TaxID=208324 RepID=A0ABV0XJR6_9TELE